jgi:hypothetical protein
MYVYALLCSGCFAKEMLLLFVSAVVVMKMRCVVKKRCNAMHVSVVVLFFLISAVFFLFAKAVSVGKRCINALGALSNSFFTLLRK